MLRSLLPESPAQDAAHTHPHTQPHNITIYTFTIKITYKQEKLCQVSFVRRRVKVLKAGSASRLRTFIVHFIPNRRSVKTQTHLPDPGDICGTFRFRFRLLGNTDV